MAATARDRPHVDANERVMVPLLIRSGASSITAFSDHVVVLVDPRDGGDESDAVVDVWQLSDRTQLLASRGMKALASVTVEGVDQAEPLLDVPKDPPPADALCVEIEWDTSCRVSHTKCDAAAYVQV
jgi:hypothetical protein